MPVNKNDFMSSFHPILARITTSNSINNISAIHFFEQRNISSITPKGYYYIPSKNDTILLPNLQSKLSLGCLANTNKKINIGEILIENDSGAYIKLSNNGSVEINSVIISKNGQIIEKT